MTNSMEYKKLKIKLPCDPAIPLLGIYLENTIVQKDTCTLMFTAALFTIAKLWKQHRCLSEGGIHYTVEYYLAIKKKEILPCEATWKDLKISILN